jgi:predicted Zn-dependent peptidase
LRDAVASDQFTIAYHAPSAFNDDSYALDVLMSVLFEGADSRAYRKLVEEKNIATGISGIAFTPTFPGLILISGAMKSGHSAEEIEPELEQLFLQAKTTPVAQADLKKAVRQLTMQVLNGVRSPQGLGRLIGNVSTVFGDPDRFSKDFAKYMKVTADDVMRVANQYLEPNSRSVVIMKRTDSE